MTRLTKQWSEDHAAFQDRDLSGADYVYVWADGVHPKVRLGKKALQEIYNAEDRDHAEKAVKDFGRAYGAKWPKAVKKITDAVDELLAFYDLMVFKLAESAQARWRAITAPHLVALVRNGARFERGVLVKREQEAAA